MGADEHAQQRDDHVQYLQGKSMKGGQGVGGQLVGPLWTRIKSTKEVTVIVLIKRSCGFCS